MLNQYLQQIHIVLAIGHEVKNNCHIGFLLSMLANKGVFENIGDSLARFSFLYTSGSLKILPWSPVFHVG